MESGHFLDIESWPRRAQFEFFRDYDVPFFNICAPVEVGPSLTWCRDHERSFALACWYVCSRAINGLEPFRYRLRGERVWVHDALTVGTTIANEDETFRFCYFEPRDGFDAFSAHARSIVAAPVPEEMDDREGDAVIHGTTLPWTSFTSISHPRRLGGEDSTPKIVLGRYETRADGRVMMPLSVSVHHGLMDGRHASRFFEWFEREMCDPENVLAT